MNSGKINLDYFLPGDRHRSHGGRSLCPRYQSCTFTDCRCIKPHWRGTHCSRDRLEHCPSCTNLLKEKKKEK